jgi:hypothetical protein
MLTDNELREGFAKRFKRPLDTSNMAALKRFITNFEAEDYTDFDEIYEALLLSMHDVSKEMDTSDNPREVLERRYAKLFSAR